MANEARFQGRTLAVSEAAQAEGMPYVRGLERTVKVLLVGAGLPARPDPSDQPDWLGTRGR